MSHQFPAFPQPQSWSENAGRFVEPSEWGSGGMSLRAYIATAVLQGMYAGMAISPDEMSGAAEDAVAQADALIAALQGKS